MYSEQKGVNIASESKLSKLSYVLFTTWTLLGTYTVYLKLCKR